MKKILLSIALLLLSFFSNTLALSYEYAVNPEYIYASDFVNDIALVSKGEEKAVIDRYGKIVVDFDKRVKRIRANGLIMVVGENDKGAFYDKNGNRLTEFVYDTYPVTDPKWNVKTYNLRESDGDGKSKLIPFSRGNKYGYINPYGKEVISPIYDYAYGFVNGIAMICSEGILSEYGTYTNGKYGFINEKGETILPSDSYWIATFYYDEGYSSAANGDKPYVLIDRDGNVKKTDDIGFAPINAKYIMVEKDGKKGVCDKNKNFIIPFGEYTDIKIYNKDFFITDGKEIRDNKNNVVYKADENTSITLLYHNIYETSRFAKLSMKNSQFDANGKSGLVSADGKVIMDIKYDNIFDMGEGLIFAEENGKRSIYNYEGKFLCEIKAVSCGQSVNGLISVTDYNGKCGYILNPLSHPKVYVNGNKLISDVYPVIKNNRTIVPARAVYESLDASVLWDDDSKTVTIKKDNAEVVLKIGSNVLYKNGIPVKTDVPAEIENSRTMIPLRAVMESLECRVNWNDEERTVEILSE